MTSKQKRIRSGCAPRILINMLHIILAIQNGFAVSIYSWPILADSIVYNSDAKTNVHQGK